MIIENRNRHTQQEILEKFLLKLPQYGWTKQALQAVWQDDPILERQYRLYFPGGLPDLATLFLTLVSQDMYQHASQWQEEKLSQRVKYAIACRLAYLQPNKQAVKALLSYLARPDNCMLMVTMLTQAADNIWKAVQDTSWQDSRYYTKRLSLAFIYISVIMFWLDDKSVDSQETLDFLDRQLQRLFVLQKYKPNTQNFGHYMTDFVKIIAQIRYNFVEMC